MRLPWRRGRIRTYLLFVCLVFGHATPKSIAFGSLFLVLGMALQVWAKGCLHQELEVTSSGPYRLVRHPYYLANAIFDLGIAIVSGWWPVLLVLPLWWFGVYLPEIRREEARMEAIFGDDYLEYRRRVPMVVPHRRPFPKPQGEFSWYNPNLLKTEAARILPLYLGVALDMRLRDTSMGRAKLQASPWPGFSPIGAFNLFLAGGFALCLAKEFLL